MSEKDTIIKPNSFTQTLNEYINSSGYSIYKISKITGLGRTAIQHTISGKLLPTRDFVEKLCSALPITPQQEEELLLLHKRSKIGDKAFFDRQYIQKLIEDLGDYYASPQISYNSTFEMPEQIKDNLVISGTINVNNVLRGVLEAELHTEKPQILTSVPFEDNLFFDMILQLPNHEKHIEFRHYIKMFKNADSSEEHGNLIILKRVLFLSMAKGIDYCPYYHYEYSFSDNDYMSLFPFLLISSKYIVMISKDFNMAFISQDAKLLNFGCRHLSELENNSRIMLNIVDEKKVLDLLAENINFCKYSIECQPCMTTYITEDIIRKRLKDIPEREETIDKIKHIFCTSQLQDNFPVPKAKCYFTEAGLENFIQTGTLPGIPGMLLNPMDIQERIFLLHRVKADTERMQMFNSSKINIPNFLQIMVLENETTIISCLTENKQFCCILQETELNSSFDDFMKSLEEDGITVDSSKMAAAIDRCIAILNENTFYNS